MSCRIDRRIIREGLAVFCISGRITGQYVEMLRDVLGREKDELVIDLKNVSLVDRDAVKLLAISEANGIELRNCPLYIRECVTREAAGNKIVRRGKEKNDGQYI
jgi:anti-anti-sigma regulatory factor